MSHVNGAEVMLFLSRDIGENLTIVILPHFMLSLKLVFLMCFNLVVQLRSMNCRFNRYNLKIYFMKCIWRLNGQNYKFSFVMWYSDKYNAMQVRCDKCKCSWMGVAKWGVYTSPLQTLIDFCKELQMTHDRNHRKVSCARTFRKDKECQKRSPLRPLIKGAKLVPWS